MANYQNYPGSGTNNGENNQFNTDLAQGNMIMQLMQNFEQVNKGQPVNNNNVNNVVYSVPANGFNFQQQLPNTLYPQYFNQLNGLNVLQMANGNPQLNLYINSNGQFVSGDGYTNNMPHFMSMPNQTQGIVQVDVNDLNKNVPQRSQTRTRKRSFNEQVKALDSGDMEFDHKNRPLIYSCKECPRKFSMNSRLNTHMRCHNGERPYVCNQCSFAFTQKSYLVRHAAVHKEERPYECMKCKKTYKHYGSLANHRKTHKSGHKDIDFEADDGVDECKQEPNCANDMYQNHDFVFNGDTKQEPQQTYMATDLTANMFPTSDVGVSYLDQLNQYPQNNVYFSNNNTDQTDVPVSAQSSSNPTSTFPN